MSTSVRKQAPRPARPVARYWRGKAPQGVAELSESEDEDETGEAQEQDEEEGVMPLTTVEGDEEDEEDEQGQFVPVKQKAVGKMNITLKDVDIKEGKVIVAGREESGRTAVEEEEPEEESEEEEDEKPSTGQGGAESDESSEYESDSEEEEPPKPAFRPVFVPKRGRNTIKDLEKEAEEQERVEKEMEQRRIDSHDMVAETIKQELLEKEKEKEVPDLDDTDGLDPEGEFEAWRLRELSRIKRDKEAQAARELEREEIEKRRALPEAQRLAEDLEYAKASRDAKPKGSQKFLQKYYHKGAFHQDLEILKRHDYTQATESTMDVSVLPKVMQVRDFGKRSRTKYTHLLDQDTTAGNGGFGGVKLKPGMGGSSGEPGGCFNCGGPHLKKDCPRPPMTGSNNTQQGQNGTRDHDRDRSRSYVDRDHASGRPDDINYGDRTKSNNSGSYRPREKNSFSGSRSNRRSRSRDGRRTSSRERYSDRRRDDDDRYPRKRDSYDSRDRRYRPRSGSRSPPRYERKSDYRDRRTYKDRSRERGQSLESDRRGKRQRTD